MKKLSILLMFFLLSSIANAKNPTCNQLIGFVSIGQSYHLKNPVIDQELIVKVGNNYIKFLDNQMLYLTKAEHDKITKDLDKNSEKYVENYFVQQCQMFRNIEKTVKVGEARYLKYINQALSMTPKKFDLEPIKDRFKTEKELKNFITKLIRNDLYNNKTVLKEAKTNYKNRTTAFNKEFEDKKTGILIKAFYRAFDPHSDYMTENESKQFEEAVSGKLIGIGVRYAVDHIGIKVEKTFTGGPADTAGIKAGEHILSVDGDKITVNNSQDFADKLTRPEGSQVVFEVLNDKDEKRSVTLTTAKIYEAETKVSSQLKEIDGKKILIVNVPSFYYDAEKEAGCAKDFLKEYDKNKDKKIDLIVMDLRNDTGGLVDQALELVGLFVGPKVVIYTKEHNQVRPFYSEVQEPLIKEPLIVLTNKLSASASEIVAGALKDYSRGIIVGDVSTYGKGTMQAVLPHAKSQEMGLIKVTTAQFYLPKGSSTQIKGVPADIVIPGPYKKINLNEGENDYALSWDEIETPLKLSYSEKIDTKTIAELSKKRVDESIDFKKHLENDAQKDEKDIILDETLNIANDYLNSQKKVTASK